MSTTDIGGKVTSRPKLRFRAADVADLSTATRRQLLKGLGAVRSVVSTRVSDQLFTVMDLRRLTNATSEQMDCADIGPQQVGFRVAVQAKHVVWLMSKDNRLLEWSWLYRLCDEYARAGGNRRERARLMRLLSGLRGSLPLPTDVVICLRETWVCYDPADLMSLPLESELATRAQVIDTAMRIIHPWE